MPNAYVVLSLFVSSLACGCALPAQPSPATGQALVQRDPVTARSRIAELETRLARLEQNPPQASSGDSALLRRLDQLIEINQQLMTDLREHKSPTEPVAKQEVVTAPSEEYLRVLVERLRGTGNHFQGPLTREQSDALRVLLKGERHLDTDNPWGHWY